MCGVNISPWVLAELDKLDAALVPEADCGLWSSRRPSPASRAAHAAPRVRRGSAGLISRGSWRRSR